MKQVTAAILFQRNKLLISRRHKEDILAGKWEFPGGKVESGETPEECLAREINEEFNIEISVGEFFTSSTYKYTHGEFELLAYFVTWLTGELSPTVHDEIAWVDIKDLHNYDFLPADIPIVDKLTSQPILLSNFKS